MKISYSTTIEAYVWHWDAAPSEYGELDATRTIVTPSMDTQEMIEFAEARVAKMNDAEQQERFLEAQRLHVERQVQIFQDQIILYGCD